MSKQVEGEAAILREGIFQLQACVVKGMTDEELVTWINSVSECGTRRGWTLEEGSEDSPKRVQCSQFDTHEHVLFNA